ncbi:MAG TPA: LytS/YhcK type 5TM receptor domain-containing protein [Bacteroidales bacterium]|nr:LytS/YhcK type 5TM receptor domain-containing protein [Bacteroidales bacterium]
MDKGIILGLIQNTAILLSFSMLYDYAWLPKKDTKSIAGKILSGLIIGSVGIILMLTPWRQVPGLVFDTRSVLLALSGLFFGLIPTVVAAIIMSIYRIFLGGMGIWMGLAVIILSSVTGILYRKFRPAWNNRNYILELTFLGFLAHIIMLACTLLLPEASILPTLKNIILPIITIYPAGTVLLGMLMVHQLKNQENQNAAEKLVESERRFIDLLTNFNYFSLILDKTGKILFCNSKIVETSGFKIDQLTGKNAFEMLLPQNSIAAVKDAFDYILRGKTGFYNYETEFKRADGEILNIEWNATVLRDANKVISSIATIGQDVTNRKKAEAELIKAKSKAEESDNLKSIFLSNMSHEIRTPMNAIMGFSSMLGMDDITDIEKKQYISIIHDSGERLLKIINDIIDISKLEAKQFSVNLSECSLNEIFRSGIETFRKSDLLKEKRNVSLVLDSTPEHAEILLITDKHRIQQVLDNLLSNAIKYTEKGTITTGYRIISENGKEYVEAYVKDTGIGIAEGMSKIVFERFRQVDENKYHEGAGLGLSITKGIIELLGGNIWFDSALNKGTTFYFRIPLIIPQNEPVSVKGAVSGIPDLSGKTIIIAEDDYNSYYYLRLLLKGLNANVLHAENGMILMRLVQHKVPDIILLDINMPVKSGFECLDEIKKLGINTLIIAQTAYAMSSEKERCLSSGCHGYIAKPVKKTDLYREISQLLAEKLPV